MSAKKLRRIRRIINELDPKLPEADPTYKAALVLLASIHIGPNARRIASFTHLPREECEEIGRRLRKGGIWRGSKIYGEWDDPKGGGIAFLLDAMVGSGMLNRAKQEQPRRPM